MTTSFSERFQSANAFHSRSIFSQSTTLPKFKKRTKSPQKGVQMLLITDDRSNLYVDGNYLNSTLSLKVTELNLGDSFEVLAIKVISDLFFIGFMAQTTSGIVTDESWKCTYEKQPNNWMAKDFDNSNWPQAVPYANNGNGVPVSLVFDLLSLKYPEFPPQSLWISVENFRYQGTIYCRSKIKA